MSNPLHLLDSAICGRMSLQTQGPYRELFLHYYAAEYDECLALAETLFKSEKDTQAKAFLLHVICAVLGNKYDMELRAKWMQKWHQVIIEDGSDFAKTAHKYHTANTCYFDSYFLEALNRYKEIATDPKASVRFKALAHFHAGLIYNHRQLSRAALIEMRSAFDLAYELGHQKLLGRIREQITLLEDGITYSFLDSDIMELLRSKNLKAAQSLYRQKNRVERKCGIHRKQSSLYALLPALAALRTGQLKSILASIELISDPAMKVQSLGFVRSLGYDFTELKSLEEYLSGDLGVTPLENNFLGHSLKGIPSEDLAKFARFILTESSVCKEGICREVWNLDYDPVMHDGKIYKLIHRFRDYFGKKDLIVNRYGKYEVNQRYRA